MLVVVSKLMINHTPAFSSFRKNLKAIERTHMFHLLNSSKQTFESHLRIKLMFLRVFSQHTFYYFCVPSGISWNNERRNLSIVKKTLNSELPYLGAIRCFTCESEMDNWECNTKSPDVFCQPGI